MYLTQGWTRIKAMGGVALARRTMNLGCKLEVMVTTDGAVRPLPHMCQVYSVTICIRIQQRPNQNTLFLSQTS
jgi:hypothetical protein